MPVPQEERLMLKLTSEKKGWWYWLVPVLGALGMALYRYLTTGSVY